ncbi:MAG: hypothetical protein LBM99_03875 [Bacillales bacterium]|jgi:ribonuclease-3|nr:hypothetical protein [Bacillales bacterium]
MLEAKLKELGLEYKNIDLYLQAFTHPNFKSINPIDYDYQRLEYLGDRVISFVVAQGLFELYAQEDEGFLTLHHNTLVNKITLGNIAVSLNLLPLLRTVTKDILNNEKVKCDVFESLVGAIFLDLGLVRVKEFILKYIDLEQVIFKDPKSRLQEYLQSSNNKNDELNYKTIKVGPDNKPEFTCEVRIGNLLYGVGKGKRIQDAEQAAAEEALKKVIK